MPDMEDQVSHLREEWGRVRPDLDPSPMITIGRLLRVAALISEEIEWFATERGISRPEGDVLMTLRRVGAPHRLSREVLARSLVLTPQGLTARLEQLERLGFISILSGSEDDSPATSVELTERGLEMVDGFLAAHVANEERLLAPLAAADRETLDALLARLIEPLEAAL